MREQKPIDPATLYLKVAHVVKTGLRTSTYKLATLNALIDYSKLHHRDIGAGALEVPLSELARNVMAVYWEQSQPFEGNRLSQSFTPTSVILDAVEVLRSVAVAAETGLTIEFAAKMAPALFQRTVDEVGLCLARQPLARLQRAGSYEKSSPFLYDDKFLNDSITPTQLQRHGNAIRLKPGVARGLAISEKRLRSMLRTVWVDDVLRMNKLPRDARPRLEIHLFAGDANQLRSASPAVEQPSNEIRAFTSAMFAARLNDLFRAANPQYSSGEVAARIRKMGFAMTVSVLTDLRSGVGPSPSEQTITALARYFGVAPSYFFGDDNDAKSGTRITSSRPLESLGSDYSAPTTRIAVRNESPEVARVPSGADSDPATHGAETLQDGDIWGRVFGDDLDEIATACEIRENGCWVRPSNTAVRCRARDDVRKPVDLPKLGLHIWAWMVANGHSSTALPSYRIQIRRNCSSSTCCNPAHLFAAAPGGRQLSREEVVTILRGMPIEYRAAVPQLRPPLDDSLAAITDYCTVDETGCWIAPTTAPVPCRVRGDVTSDAHLVRMTPHRWAWMVTHGFASTPLSSDEFHVRRRCGKKKCCKPEHLFLTDLYGQAITDSQIGELRRSAEKRDLGTKSSSRSLFAERLNSLFERFTRPEGIPYTSEEVADALQDDGLLISEALIEGLRSGSSDAPHKAIEALSYFFNVDPDYFSPEKQLKESSTEDRYDTRGWTKPTADSHSSAAQVVEISITEAGRIVAGLSEVVSGCLQVNPVRAHAAMRLLPMLVHIGELLTTSERTIVIELAVLQQLIGEWDAATRNSEHQSVIARLSRLADGG